MHLRADAARKGRRNETDAGHDAGHQHRAHLHFAHVLQRFGPRHALFDVLVEIGEHQDAVHGGDSEQCDEADGGGDAERCVGHEQRQHAADQRHRDHAGDQQHFANSPEVQVQQERDQQDGHRHRNRQALQRFLKVAELADPFEPVAGRQLQFGSDLALRFEHRGAEVAAAHAELHRHIALLLLPVDERRARHQRQGCNFTQGDLHRAVAGGVGRCDADASNGVDVTAVRLCQAHHERKVPIPAGLVQIPRRLTSDCGLHCRIDVARRQPVAGRAIAIDDDLQGRLPQ